MDPIGNSFKAGNLRIDTRKMTQRTSSNQTFSESLNSLVKEGIDTSRSAVDVMGLHMPGGAQVSAVLSNASRFINQSNLNNSSSLPVGIGNVSDIQGDSEADLMKANQELVKKQLQIGQFTAILNMQSHIAKAWFDLMKSVGNNIR